MSETILNLKRKSIFHIQEDVKYFLNSKFSNLEFFLSKKEEEAKKKEKWGEYVTGIMQRNNF